MDIRITIMTTDFNLISIDTRDMHDWKYYDGDKLLPIDYFIEKYRTAMYLLYTKISSTDIIRFNTNADVYRDKVSPEDDWRYYYRISVPENFIKPNGFIYIGLHVGANTLYDCRINFIKALKVIRNYFICEGKNVNERSNLSGQESENSRQSSAL